jgi:hypothetical protein
LDTYRRDNDCRYDRLQQEQTDCVEEAGPPGRPPLDARLVENHTLKRHGLNNLQQAQTQLLEFDLPHVMRLKRLWLRDRVLPSDHIRQ